MYKRQGFIKHHDPTQTATKLRQNRPKQPIPEDPCNEIDQIDQIGTKPRECCLKIQPCGENMKIWTTSEAEMGLVELDIEGVEAKIDLVERDIGRRREGFDLP